eukprot:13989214-Alexandrium_andersonii.AAC.1
MGGPSWGGLGGCSEVALAPAGRARGGAAGRGGDVREWRTLSKCSGPPRSPKKRPRAWGLGPRGGPAVWGPRRR